MRTIISIVCFVLLLPACTHQHIEGPTGIWEEMKEAYRMPAQYSEERMLALAEAFPQTLYDWRPMEGVRSVAEVFLHVATINYDIVHIMGGSLPEEIADPWELETLTTDKSRIMEELKKSFEFVDNYIASIPETDYDRKVDYYGMEITILDLIFEASGHLREHVGQQIAYARTNKIVPPWSVQ
jgi:uncharacterized damage-inducible protein DinB